jgi:hypothetical protein
MADGSASDLHAVAAQLRHLNAQMSKVNENLHTMAATVDHTEVLVDVWLSVWLRMNAKQLQREAVVEVGHRGLSRRATDAPHMWRTVQQARPAARPSPKKRRV